MTSARNVAWMGATALVGSMAFSWPSIAADYRYYGPSGNSWSDPSGWTSPPASGPATSLIFLGPSPAIPVTTNDLGEFTLNRLRFDTSYYSGVLTINATPGSNLAFDGVNAGVNSAGRIVFNTPITLNTSTSFFARATINGTVSGTGTLRIQESVTLLADAVHTGGTYIFFGKHLFIGDHGTVGSLAGDTELGRGALFFQRSDTVTYAGVISGEGSLYQRGAGILILTGDSTFSGRTEVDSGTLQIGNGGASGALASDIVNRASVVFHRSDDHAYGGVISGAGQVTKLGNGVLTLTGENTYTSTTIVSAGTLQIGDGGTTGAVAGNISNSAAVAFNRADDVVYAGDISGTGDLTKLGAGTLSLTGSNTYSGGTTIKQGTLAISTAGAIGSAYVALNGGMLRAEDTMALWRTFIVHSGGFAAAAGKTLTIQGAFTAMPGSNLVFGEAGVDGTVDLSVTGLAYSLPFQIEVVGGTLRFSNSYALVTYAESTVVRSGATLDLGPSALHPVRSLQGEAGSRLTADAGQTIAIGGGSFAGEISGSIAVRVLAPGASQTGLTVLSGTNSYTGGTIIDAGGTLRLGNGGTTGSIAGDVENHGTLAFARSDRMSFGGTMSGSGEVRQEGAGTTTLTAANTYTGATLVNAGTLIVNGSIAASSGVTVAAGATLGGSGVVPTTVINGGTLSPGNSPGRLTVNGNLTFNPGSTYLAEVQGAVSDRVDVTGTASLAGTLRIAPLGGAYSFNSAYTLLSAAGGLGGTRFSPVDTTGFGDGVTTTVSYASNAVLLTLAPKPLVPIVVDPVPTPTPSSPHLGVGRPANAYAIAVAIDGAVANGGDPSALFGIYNLPAAAIPAAVNSLSGEVHTAAPAMASLASDQFLRVMLDPTAAGRLGDTGAAGPGAAVFTGLVRKGADQPLAASRLDLPFYSVWGSAYGSYGRTDGNAGTGAARRTLDDAHLATGVDIRLLPGTVAGLAVSGGKARASLPGLLGKIDADVFQAGLYGVTLLGPLRLGGALSYTRLENDISRSIPALGSALASSYATTAWSGRLQASAALLSWNGLSFSPLAAIQATRARSPAVTEANWAGGNAGALALGRRSDVTARSELGLQLDADTVLGGIAVTGHVRAAWAHYFERDADLTASLVGLPGATFTATGAEADRDSALVSAGVMAKLSENVSLGLNLDGELSANSNQLGGSAQLRVSF